MADFCKQCSIEMFGEDFRDLAGLGPLQEGECHVVICEGCGFIAVNEEGECMVCDLYPDKPGHDLAKKEKQNAGH